MPIDDNQFDTLQKQFQMEDLSLSPVTKVVLDIVSSMPPIWPFDKIVQQLKGHLAVDSWERLRLLLETCMNEVRKHDNEIKRMCERMTVEETQSREETLRGLVLDAARKSESTRAKDRVRRIGLILANAIVDPKPTDADEVEEMMRIAMELGDRDVVFLRELFKIEGPMLEMQDHIPRYQAHMAWEQCSWGTRIDPQMDSTFSKLESYGLVTRIPPTSNLNIMADFQNRFVLLKRGARFLTLIRESAAARS